MRYFTRHTDLPEDARGASAAIGNFDGVHLGHHAVIDLARGASDRLGCPLGIVTFDPHPREFFAPDTPAFRLMTPRAKAHRLAKIIKDPGTIRGGELAILIDCEASIARVAVSSFGLQGKEALALQGHIQRASGPLKGTLLEIAAHGPLVHKRDAVGAVSVSGAAGEI
jgi:hypothetical protein